MYDLARFLMLLGGGIFVLGLALSVAGRMPWLGNLPGDIVVKRDNFTLFAPIGTMIVLSVLLTLVLNVVARLLR
ncbi:MAG: DUF2905 domain-containing protein [Caldilineaceae bacterium]|nr:DUF2905 domain-containing protein [Caldilineaceae bacterium]